MAVLSVIVLSVGGGDKRRREERGLRLLDCSLASKVLDTVWTWPLTMTSPATSSMETWHRDRLKVIFWREGVPSAETGIQLSISLSARQFCGVNARFRPRKRGMLHHRTYETSFQSIPARPNGKWPSIGLSASSRPDQGQYTANPILYVPFRPPKQPTTTPKATHRQPPRALASFFDGPEAKPAHAAHT